MYTHSRGQRVYATMGRCGSNACSVSIALCSRVWD